ncbi:MAG: NIF family HAD-type phosphatase [Bdellovibrionia bacterium]
MRNIRSTCAFLLAACLSFATSAGAESAHHQEPIIDVVFDLDDTLIRWVRPDEAKSGTLIPAMSQGKPYLFRVLDGTPEILESLSRQPGVRISFFSMGERSRNETVLSQLKLPSGRTAREIAYRVLSLEDATQVNGESHKDLRLVNPDLERVLIVDDQKNAPIPGQERNVLWLGGKPEHFYESLHDTPGSGATWKPASPEKFVEYRNRLAYARGLIDRVLTESKKSGSIGVVEALAAQQWSRDSAGLPVFRSGLRSDLSLYRKGAAEFHAVNSRYGFTTAYTGPERRACLSEAISEFLKIPYVERRVKR